MYWYVSFVVDNLSLSCWGLKGRKIITDYGAVHNINVYVYDKHPCIYSKDIKNHIHSLVNLQKYEEGYYESFGFG
jgi:hypothetical protein